MRLWIACSASRDLSNCLLTVWVKSSGEIADERIRCGAASRSGVRRCSSEWILETPDSRNVLDVIWSSAKKLARRSRGFNCGGPVPLRKKSCETFTQQHILTPTGHKSSRNLLQLDRLAGHNSPVSKTRTAALANNTDLRSAQNYDDPPPSRVEPATHTLRLQIARQNTVANKTDITMTSPVWTKQYLLLW